ncbi:hypothetical protein [Tenacibaculum sp. E3R01]|nr:hypothetical protein [Tenacibaculum sp. E3R01]
MKNNYTLEEQALQLGGGATTLDSNGGGSTDTGGTGDGSSGTGDGGKK